MDPVKCFVLQFQVEDTISRVAEGKMRQPLDLSSIRAQLGSLAAVSFPDCIIYYFRLSFVSIFSCDLSLSDSSLH